MITKKYLISGIIAAFVLVGAAITIPFIVIEPFERKYVESEPIVIWGDEDFYVYNFPGRGTTNNPFRIENYNITTDQTVGISIWNTTLSFVIEHCLIIANDTGILIDSVASESAIIEDNICSNNKGYGIFIYNSPNLSLIQNACSNNKYGIFIHSSMGCKLIENACTNNNIGIVIYYSPLSSLSNCVITNNYIGTYIGFSLTSSITECRISNNIEGLSLEESDTAHLGENTIANNDVGILIKESYYSSFENNAIFNNYYGIHIANTTYNHFENNQLTYNGYAFYLNSNVNNCVISYNYFEKNYEYAIYIQLFNYDNLIHHNTFFNNSAYGTSQAYDNGINTWYDTATNEGNWWDDHTGSGSYQIDGIMGNSDPYPLESRPV